MGDTTRNFLGFLGATIGSLFLIVMARIAAVSEPTDWVGLIVCMVLASICIAYAIACWRNELFL